MSMPFAASWHRKMIFLAAVAFMVSTAFFLAWQHYFPVTAGEGWTWKIYLDDIDRVSALARDEQGTLYLTQERNNQRGKLLKQLPNGTLQEVMAGLDKPDGLAIFRSGILISQESSESPVLWLHQGQKTELFRGRHIEGIASDGKFIYAIEDVSQAGRLLRYDSETRQVGVLREDLNVGEGLAICPDGRIFYSEKEERLDQAVSPGAGTSIRSRTADSTNRVFCCATKRVSGLPRTPHTVRDSCMPIRAARCWYRPRPSAFRADHPARRPGPPARGRAGAQAHPRNQPYSSR
jgi:hypothetical protein